MANLQHTEFAFVDGIAVFHPHGLESLNPMIQAVRDAFARANAQHLRKLLIVLTEVTGYDVPSLAMRQSMLREWAGAAGSVVSVAMVCRPEFIDPQKFGITVAANFGIVMDVFESKDEAMNWLRELD